MARAHSGDRPTVSAIAVLLALLVSEAASAQGLCGMGVHDWCKAPNGDVCNIHHDAASCRADARCTAMPYRGESVVACIYDKRGFPTNCPVVGCISIKNRAKLRKS